MPSAKISLPKHAKPRRRANGVTAYYFIPPPSARPTGYTPPYSAVGKLGPDATPQEIAALHAALTRCLEEFEAAVAGMKPIERPDRLLRLLSIWRRDDAGLYWRGRIAASTMRTYEKGMRPIEEWLHAGEKLAGRPVCIADCNAPAIRAFLSRFADRPHYRDTIRVCLAKLWEVAIEEGVADRNLVNEMRRDVTPRRKAQEGDLWTEEEFARFCDAARSLGRWDVLRVASFCRWHAQRISDGLLQHRDWYRRRPGWIVFEQRKTGTTVEIPCYPQHLAVMAECDDAEGLRFGELVLGPDGTPHIHPDARSKPSWRKAFNDVVAAAGVQKEPRHWRHTGVTEMKRARLTIPEICERTGHSMASATRILESYMAKDSSVAEAGAQKLVEFRDRQNRNAD